MGFFSRLLGDVGELLGDTASNLGEMGGNIVGGTLEGLGGALRDPTFVKGALIMAGLAYAGPNLFVDSAGNLFTAEQATGMAGVTPGEIASTFGGAGAMPSTMAEFAPVTMPGLGAEAAIPAGANALAPTIGAGAGGETAAALGADFAGANALAPTAAGAAGTAAADANVANALKAAGTGAAGNALSSSLIPAAIVGSSLVGANAAQNAAETQAAAQQRANDLMYKMFQEQVGLQAPFREAGLTAQNRMLDLLGLSDRTGTAGYGSLNKPFGMEQFQSDPGYAFRMNEGIKALERSRAAQVGGTPGLLSGATGKALVRYGQDLGTQEYGNAFNRYQIERANQLNPLAALTAAGQGSANVLSNAAGTYGREAGAGTANIGAAQAAGQIGTANALAGGVSQYLGYMNNQNLADALRRSQYGR